MSRCMDHLQSFSIHIDHITVIEKLCRLFIHIRIIDVDPNFAIRFEADLVHATGMVVVMMGQEDPLQFQLIFLQEL